MNANFGGIGVPLDSDGNIKEVAEHRHEPLTITFASGAPAKVIDAPPTGWSQPLLILALLGCKDAISADNCAHALLGSVWIGSTEV